MPKFSSYLRGAKNFWNEFKRSKRGLLGIAIILFFGVIAIIAPVLTPYDPMTPTWPKYFPTSELPRIADMLCVPIWYKQLPGGGNLSENLEVVPEYEFSKEEDLTGLWTVDAPSNYVTITHNSTMGTRPGAIQIAYKRLGTESPPGSVAVTLSRQFAYPFNNPPRSFWMHISTYVKGITITEKPPLTRILIHHEDKDNNIVDFEYITPNRWRSLSWLSTSPMIERLVGSQTPSKAIFTKAGNYTLTAQLTIFDSENGEKDLTIILDDFNVILYGEAFGLLGTDSDRRTPRDLFTMLVHGTRISFMVGLLAATFSVFIGLFAGLVAGYVGGLADEGIMRFADLLLVIPSLPLMIALVIVIGSSIWNIIGILIFMGWMGFSRNVRSMVLSLRERQFVEAAKAVGAGRFYILRKHILPHIFALVYITLATAVPGAIIAEASLSWLGLGDITIPSWGTMFFEYERAAIGALKAVETWYWVVPPGIAITMMATAFVLFGFALDETLNPRLRERR